MNKKKNEKFKEALLNYDENERKVQRRVTDYRKKMSAKVRTGKVDFPLLLGLECQLKDSTWLAILRYKNLEDWERDLRSQTVKVFLLKIRPEKEWKVAAFRTAFLPASDRAVMLAIVVGRLRRCTELLSKNISHKKAAAIVLAELYWEETMEEGDRIYIPAEKTFVVGQKSKSKDGISFSYKIEKQLNYNHIPPEDNNLFPQSYGELIRRKMRHEGRWADRNGKQPEPAFIESNE